MLGLAIFSFTRPKTPKFELAQVKKGDIKATVSASGSLAGKNTANLKFKGGGKLAYINVKTGDRIRAGQTIASLETQDLTIALNQANNNLRDKQVTLNKVLDDIHLAQYGNGGFVNVGSSNETETQKQTRTSAEVARDNAYEAVKEAQRKFNDAVIITPFAAVVTEVNIFPGQFVTGDTAIQVIDDSVVLFDAEVDEADAGKVKVDQEVETTLDAFPDQIFKGKVSEILPQTKLTSANATVAIAKVLIDHLPDNVVFGLNGQASIITQEAKNVLTVPAEALGEENQVFVQKEKGVEPVQVEVGISSDTDVEIKNGLHEGDKVVLNPPSQIQQPRNPLSFIFRITRGRR